MGAAAKALAIAVAVALLVAAIAPPGQVGAQQVTGTYCLLSDPGTSSKIRSCLQQYQQTKCLSKDCCEAINKIGIGCLGQALGGGTTSFSGDLVGADVLNPGKYSDLNFKVRNICGVGYNV